MSGSIRREMNSDGVIRLIALNCRQKWELCLNPSSKATFFTESPANRRSWAATKRRSFNHSWGERPKRRWKILCSCRTEMRESCANSLASKRAASAKISHPFFDGHFLMMAR